MTVIRSSHSPSSAPSDRDVPGSRPRRWAGPRGVLAVGVSAALLLGASACTGNVVKESTGDDGNGPVVGVAATPAASPAAADPAGRTGRGAPVRDLARLGDDSGAPGDVALLREGSLEIGAPSDLVTGRGRTVDVPRECTTLSTTSRGVTAACGGSVIVVDGDGRTVRTVQVDGTATAAAVIADGTVAVAVEGRDRMQFYGADGAFLDDDPSSDSVDATVLLHDRNGGERLAAVDHAQSSVTEMRLSDRKYLAALRIGQGVGTMAAGSGTDGVAVASDTRQDQALLYTLDEVVMLHQSVPTGPSPYAVTWDSPRALMWVSTTGDNRLTAYRVDSGTPVEVRSFGTVRDVRRVVDGRDGSLLLTGDDGTLQMIPADQVTAAVRS